MVINLDVRIIAEDLEGEVLDIGLPSGSANFLLIDCLASKTMIRLDHRLKLKIDLLMY